MTRCGEPNGVASAVELCKVRAKWMSAGHSARAVGGVSRGHVARGLGAGLCARARQRAVRRGRGAHAWTQATWSWGCASFARFWSGTTTVTAAAERETGVEGSRATREELRLLGQGVPSSARRPPSSPRSSWRGCVGTPRAPGRTHGRVGRRHGEAFSLHRLHRRYRRPRTPRATFVSHHRRRWERLPRAGALTWSPTTVGHASPPRLRAHPCATAHGKPHRPGCAFTDLAAHSPHTYARGCALTDGDCALTHGVAYSRTTTRGDVEPLAHAAAARGRTDNESTRAARSPVDH